jgi:hypothetical protein
VNVITFPHDLIRCWPSCSSFWRTKMHLSGVKRTKAFSCSLNCNSQIREMLVFSTYKSKRGMGAEVKLYAILNKALDANNLSVPRFCHFSSWERDRGIHSVGSWLGLRIGLVTLERKKSLGTAGNQNTIPRISFSFSSLIFYFTLFIRRFRQQTPSEKHQPKHHTMKRHYPEDIFVALCN